MGSGFGSRPFGLTLDARGLIFGALAATLVHSSCAGDQPLGGGGPAPCRPSAAQVFLHSKIDDDDGDGNPRDEHFPPINDEDDDIADHAWIRDGSGLYHLFFQNEGRATGSAIEHYTSTDFRSLVYVGVALQPDPSGWDSYALWAPYIVQDGSTYFMFYTGTTGPNNPNNIQRLGVATSQDLVHWTRVAVNNCPGTTGSGCVYECAESWTTTVRAPGSYNQQCRDAFVLWDDANRRWVLFATTKSTNGYGVVTVAYSTNLTTWTGAGFINATRRLATGSGGQTTGGQAENPFVVLHDGTYDLLFTDWQDPQDSCAVDHPRTMVQYATSTSLTADPMGSLNWIYRGYTPDPGVNAIEIVQPDPQTWIMSQSIAEQESGDHPLHRRELRLKSMIWGANGAFTTRPVLR